VRFAAFVVRAGSCRPVAEGLATERAVASAYPQGCFTGARELRHAVNVVTGAGEDSRR